MDRVYSGAVDVSMQSHVEGWSARGGEPAPVEIFVNGVSQGKTDPTTDRPDVAAEGYALRSGWIFHHRTPLLESDAVTVKWPDGSLMPMPGPGHAPRIRRMTTGIDRESMRGLEMGPLERPLLAKSHYRVSYVDHASREDLLSKYGSQFDAAAAQRLVPVDIVWPAGSLRSCIRSGQSFDFAVASHVVEHVPDMISWLNHISDVLKDGGVINLAVPDKEQTFDRFRQTTHAAEIIDDYYRKLTRPGPRQIFDHVAFASPGANPEYHPSEAWHAAETAEKNQAYLDVHCRVFTCRSFLEVFRVLVDARQLRLRLNAFFPTLPGTNEFIASLQKSANCTTGEVAATYAAALEALPSLIAAIATTGTEQAWRG